MKGRGGKREEGHARSGGPGWIYGIHSALAVLDRRPDSVIEVLCQEDARGRRAEVADLARSLSLPISTVSLRELSEATGSSAHQGVAIRAPMPEFAELEDILVGPGLVIALDGITDPHNLGAIARSAEAFGALGLIIPADRSASPGPVAHKASAGALEYLPVVQVVNLARAIRKVKEGGWWAYGADPEGETSISQADFDARALLVVGSEDRGIRPGVDKELDFRVRVPMRGRTKSLNAAQASAIIISRIAGTWSAGP